MRSDRLEEHSEYEEQNVENDPKPSEPDRLVTR